MFLLCRKLAKKIIRLNFSCSHSLLPGYGDLVLVFLVLPSCSSVLKKTKILIRNMVSWPLKTDTKRQINLSLSSVRTEFYDRTNIDNPTKALYYEAS